MCVCVIDNFFCLVGKKCAKPRRSVGDDNNSNSNKYNNKDNKDSPLLRGRRTEGNRSAMLPPPPPTSTTRRRTRALRALAVIGIVSVPVAVADALVLGPVTATTTAHLGISSSVLSESPHLLIGAAATGAGAGIDPRYFLAGGLCAAISHGITTPVDVVKTTIQSDPGSYEGLGLPAAAAKVAAAGGSGNPLLRGLGPTVVGYGLEGAAKFGLYESLKPVVSGLLGGGGDAGGVAGVAFVAASVVAGGAASVILCPLERTRIRLVTDPALEGSGFAESFRVVALEQRDAGDENPSPPPPPLSGIGAGLFRGLPAMLSKQCPYTLGKQVTYDAVCKTLYDSKIGTVAAAATTATATAASASASVEQRIGVSLAAASCAAVIACLLSHPGDVVLTETYRERGGNDSSSSSVPAPTGFPAVVAEIYNERGGARGFYAGLGARLVQVGGIIVSQLLLYDVLKQSLGLPATGT